MPKMFYMVYYSKFHTNKWESCCDEKYFLNIENAKKYTESLGAKIGKDEVCSIIECKFED